MPGYPRERFVNLNDNESEELCCGICLDVLKDPKVVTCCRSTYCSECIYEWLQNNKTCPNDRKTISAVSLSDPPRIIENLIMKLTISCNFADIGCEETVKLDDLDNHVLKCKFNPKRACNTCGFCGNRRHDCITELQLTNVKLLEKIENMEKPNSSALEQEFHQKMVIKSAKNKLSLGSEPVIRQCIGFQPRLKRKLMEIIGRVLDETSSYDKISERINAELTSLEWDQNVWHVIALPKGFGETLVRPKHNYIDLTFGELRLEIFCS